MRLKALNLVLVLKPVFYQAHKIMDEILWDETTGYTRRSNNLGGFEGGMTNGEVLVVRGVMKPIPTLYKPLQSVDISTKEVYKASIERSDSTAVSLPHVWWQKVLSQP